MNLLEADKFFLFLIFFVPGFISIKIYDLLVLADRRDISKSMLEAIGYSCINYGSLSWLIILVHSNNFPEIYRAIYYSIIFLIFFIFPIIWPILLLRLLTWRPITKYFNSPIPKPWDYIFLKRESFWIIVHLKDGRKIGGMYDHDSFASLYPIEE